MGAANPGGREVRVAEVFVECTEKTEVAFLASWGRPELALVGGEHGSRRGKTRAAESIKDGRLGVY